MKKVEEWLIEKFFSKALPIKRLRITVFCINLFFILAGLVVLSLGIATLTIYQPYKEFLGTHLWLHGVGLMVVGGITIVITFSTFFRKTKKNACLLLYFFVVLNVLFVFEAISGVVVFVENSSLDKTVTKGLNETFIENESNDKVWKHLQTQMKCCGSNGADDWLQRNQTVPISCCATEQLPCTKEVARKIGCKSPLLHYFEVMTSISASFSVTFGLIQIMVIAFAFYLYKMFKRSCGEHIEQFL